MTGSRDAPGSADAGVEGGGTERGCLPGGSGTTVVDGMRLDYRRAGTAGPPVVLLHGAGIDDAALTWKHAIGALASDCRVYAPDWPGHGDSQAGDIDHGVPAYVQTLEGFLDAVGVDSAAVAGLSMGGGAALGFALAAPDRVDRLALLDSYGLGQSVPVGAYWHAMAHVPGSNAAAWAVLGSSEWATRTGLGSVVYDASTLPDAFVAEVRDRARRPGAGDAFAAFVRNELSPDGSVRTDFTDDLPVLDCPTLLVHGAADRLFPPSWSRRAADRIPDARLHVLDRCGHWPPRERPDAVNRLLRSFLVPEDAA